jgi:hypothetical protein
MQGSYIWNKYALHRHQIIVTLALLLAAGPVLAQSFQWARQHNPNYDERKFSYGFSIGLHTSAYEVKYSDQFIAKKFDTVHSVQPQFVPGFSLGFLVNYRLNEFFDLRLMPKAGFYSHRLTYLYTNRTTQSQLIESTMVEFPLLVKFKSMRRGNVRMYMVGGFTPAIEASSKNEMGNSSGSIPILKRNISLDAGIGFDFYFPLFKFSPELRFSRGIVDMLGNEPSIYKDPLGRLNTNTIGVYLIFQ